MIDPKIKLIPPKVTFAQAARFAEAKVKEYF